MTSEHIRVRAKIDVEQARHLARDAAAAVGFSPLQRDILGLVATELATNLVRHAVGGELTITQGTHEGRAYVEIVSEDQGPGIPDITAAFQDGVTSRGGLGGGLPSVRRLMDDLEITSDSSGTRIMVKKWA